MLAFPYSNYLFCVIIIVIIIIIFIFIIIVGIDLKSCNIKSVNLFNCKPVTVQFRL